eukprot:364490-Chlamydomonas_euryale.AAC.4
MPSQYPSCSWCSVSLTYTTLSIPAASVHKAWLHVGRVLPHVTAKLLASRADQPPSRPVRPSWASRRGLASDAAPDRCGGAVMGP